MQTRIYGFSHNEKEEDLKRVHNSENGVDLDVSGNKYCAAFMAYCQKTIETFPRMCSDQSASQPGDEEEELGRARRSTLSTIFHADQYGEQKTLDNVTMASNFLNSGGLNVMSQGENDS